jgi:hypothetical protein
VKILFVVGVGVMVVAVVANLIHAYFEPDAGANIGLGILFFYAALLSIVVFVIGVVQYASRRR